MAGSRDFARIWAYRAWTWERRIGRGSPALDFERASIFSSLDICGGGGPSARGVSYVVEFARFRMHAGAGNPTIGVSCFLLRRLQSWPTVGQGATFVEAIVVSFSGAALYNGRHRAHFRTRGRPKGDVSVVPVEDDAAIRPLAAHDFDHPIGNRRRLRGFAEAVRRDRPTCSRVSRASVLARQLNLGNSPRSPHRHPDCLACRDASRQNSAYIVLAAA